ncbi:MULTISPECIES: helix-turn-helix domain-containing protein [unclassified Halobacterium]|uniref:winged helix-turn-helix domain-containing protein n=1 Tax=unclassified Halobacterium TaxID=2668073 RepID=UPI001964BB24|nr:MULTISPECIES: helix-turn-helix domain-containing protein [unclassified Halobacterium]QRY22563.1 helix-turn-helix transcriptional regulator [Halobacterium sp. GSL-19]QRY24628.1 helix-turn-helix domain-containing protein [Halobacterium sp. BOL4-2]
MRAPFDSDDTPDLQDVLDALDDAGCRDIIEALDEPRTAKEISDRSGVPMSTTYRKLDLLTDAALLEERAVLQDDGHHTTEYVVAFEDVVITLDDDDRTLGVGIHRPPTSTDERLETLWTEVSKET